MNVDLGNLPPDLTEPPPDANGWLAFQPSTSKVWWGIGGVWLRIEEALALREARQNQQ
jgi:hypothetical protein